MFPPSKPSTSMSAQSSPWSDVRGLNFDVPAAGRGERLGGLVFGYLMDVGALRVAVVVAAQTVVATEEFATLVSESRKVCGEYVEVNGKICRVILP